MKRRITSLLACAITGFSFAQWSPTTISADRNVRALEVTKYYTLDLEKIRTQLESSKSARAHQATIIEIPSLNGTIERFKVYSLSVLDPAIEARYQLGSYTGTSIDNPNTYIRFSTAPNDFQSMIYRNGTYEFIEPVDRKKSVYKVIPKSNKTSLGKAFECRSHESFLSKQEINKLEESANASRSIDPRAAKTSDQNYRTYRLAISVTGEYTQYFGGVANALAAINATMTRVNGVFERDFAIHLNVQDFPELIFTDPKTDPYSDSEVGADGKWSVELQTTLTSTIGNNAYDIGHLFGRDGGGGNAGDIGNVCRNPKNNADDEAKGSAYTSPGQGGVPEGDAFDIDYVAHEMGHQFGAEHTFSDRIERGSRVQVELGSGSTIMGYAGITDANVQHHSDPYFHGVSIDQIQTYVKTQTCGQSVVIANKPPVIQPLTSKTIPNGTAFELKAEAYSPNGNPLTYAWEQTDYATTPVTAVSDKRTKGPMFRSFPPVVSPSRSFPKFSTVANGSLVNVNEWEAVPSVARTLRFAVTVRDNNPNPNEQQTSSETLTLTVGKDGPFKVNTSKVFNNKASEVVWDVANTSKTPYNTPNVSISYSKDNGNTWVGLLESTPNDGKEVVDFSSIAAGTTIILKISAIDNVFYAVNKVLVSKEVSCNGEAPTNIKSSNITSTKATLSWDGVPNATYVTQYKKANANTSWIEKPSSTTNVDLTDLEEDTDYEVQVATVCSGTRGTFSNSMHLVTNTTFNYCQLLGENATEEYISNVKISDANGIVFSNAGTGKGYMDYTKDRSLLINLVKSSTQKIEINKAWKGTKEPTTVFAWIDFNRDGTFSADELILSEKPNKNDVASATFSIPESAYAGDKTLRLRIALAYGRTNISSCGSIKYGDVIDYSVLIDPKLAVTDPSLQSKVVISPNPVTQVLHVTNVTKEAAFSILNMAGQVVKNGKLSNQETNVSNLEKGIYILSIETHEGAKHVKFIKQ